MAYIHKMTIAKRLDEVMRAAGFKSQSALSRASGVPQPTINRILKGGGRSGPETETLRKLAAACGVTVEDLLSKGDISLAGNSFSRANVGHTMVPIVSHVAAGGWSEAVDIYATGVAEEWCLCPVKHGKRTFALRVRGVSMENLGSRTSYSDGDIIFVDPDRHADNGSMVVVLLEGEKEATFKQLVAEGERKFLRALNLSWPERMVEINGNAKFCGVVIGKWVDS